MKNVQLDYTNQFEVRNYINTTVVELIKEDLNDCPSEDQDDCLYEIIDGLSDVIYNYQAQKVAEAFDMSPFDESEMSGERFTSYNQMAFEVILQAYNDK